MSEKTDDSRRGFIANYFLKRNIQRNMSDPTAMKLGTLIDYVLIAQLAIGLIGAIYFAVQQKPGESYMFLIPLVALTVIFTIICMTKAYKIQRLSVAGGTEEMKRVNRQGMTLICVLSAFWLATACALVYYLLQ